MKAYTLALVCGATFAVTIMAGAYLTTEARSMACARAYELQTVENFVILRTSQR
jgi:hypothetical protein